MSVNLWRASKRMQKPGKKRQPKHIFSSKFYKTLWFLDIVMFFRRSTFEERLSTCNYFRTSYASTKNSCNKLWRDTSNDFSGYSVVRIEIQICIGSVKHYSYFVYIFRRAGSRRVFGVVVEKQVIVLIDTSGSMESSMDELRKELTSLIWDQFHKNDVR